MATSKVARALKAYRKEANLSVRRVAKELGWRASRYQHYEDRYTKSVLPLDLVKKIAVIFANHGYDPFNVVLLSGVSYEEAGRIVIEELGIKFSSDKHRREIIRPTEPVFDQPAFLVRKKDYASVQFIETSIDDSHDWFIPARFIQDNLKSTIGGVMMVTAMEEGFEPDVFVGDIVFLVYEERDFSEPGIYWVATRLLSRVEERFFVRASRHPKTGEKLVVSPRFGVVEDTERLSSYGRVAGVVRTMRT